MSLFTNSDELPPSWGEMLLTLAMRLGAAAVLGVIGWIIGHGSVA